jgi:alpha-galactosidase/6-phospho-beta-glucosidase family protein
MGASRMLKITVIGGGSTYTPELINGLLLERKDTLPVDEVWLMDIVPERLETVGRICAADGDGLQVIRFRWYSLRPARGTSRC